MPLNLDPDATPEEKSRAFVAWLQAREEKADEVVARIERLEKFVAAIYRQNEAVLQALHAIANQGIAQVQGPGVAMRIAGRTLSDYVKKNRANIAKAAADFFFGGTPGGGGVPPPPGRRR